MTYDVSSSSIITLKHIIFCWYTSLNIWYNYWSSNMNFIATFSRIKQVKTVYTQRYFNIETSISLMVAKVRAILLIFKHLQNVKFGLLQISYFKGCQFI